MGGLTTTRRRATIGRTITGMAGTRKERRKTTGGRMTGSMVTRRKTIGWVRMAMGWRGTGTSTMLGRRGSRECG